jgi:hypothetical protein
MLGNHGLWSRWKPWSRGIELPVPPAVRDTNVGTGQQLESIAWLQTKFTKHELFQAQCSVVQATFVTISNI